MTKLRDAVRADLKKQREAYRASSAWLQNAVSFSHSLQLLSENRILADKLFNEVVGGNVRKREQRKKDLEVLLANLIYSGRKKPVRISLNRNSWTPDQYKAASYFTIELVRILHQKEYLSMKKGYSFKATKRMARIWATEKLLEYMPLLPNRVVDIPVELVELRDDKGKLKAYRDTIQTIRVRDILQRVNAVNQKAAHSGEVGRLFRMIPATDSGRKRPGIGAKRR